MLKLIVLEELNFLKYRNLKKLPEGFGDLKYLTILYVNECEALEELPSGLPSLVAL